MSLSGEPIVILGTFRGGTSCLATALVAMGLYMGDSEAVQAANELNQSGFWELQDIQALNAQAMAIYGMSYLGADHMSPLWRDRPESDALLAQARTILIKHFSGKPAWGWKEPGTSSLFELYSQLFKDLKLTPRFPIMVRHPLSVAASRKRQFFLRNAAPSGDARGLLPPDEQRALGFWVDLTLSNLYQTKGAPRLVICYEDLLENPRVHLERLAGMLPWKPTPEQIQAAVDTINPEWSHSRFSVDDLRPWPSIVQRTYDLALRTAADPEGLTAGKFDPEIDAGWEEWQSTSNMVRSLQMPAGHFVLSWREGGEVKHDDQTFSPTGGWQTMRSTVSGSAGEPVQVSVYQMPCQAWIKRAVWHVGGKEVPAPLSPGPNGFLDQPGMLRLSSLGPGGLVTKVPDGASEAELELEFLIMFDFPAVSAVAGAVKGRLDAARRSGR